MPHSALVSLMGCIVCMLVISSAYQKDTTPRVRARISAVTVWFLGIAAWPFIWASFVNKRRNEPHALVGLLWPIIILAIDIRALNYTTYEVNTQSNRSVITMDANAMCSLTFAVSGLLGAQKDSCCRDMFLYAIIGCIAFVLPAPHTNNNNTENVVIESIQKTMLAYATGLLLTGIMLMISSTKKTVTS